MRYCLIYTMLSMEKQVMKPTYLRFFAQIQLDTIKKSLACATLAILPIASAHAILPTPEEALESSPSANSPTSAITSEVKAFLVEQDSTGQEVLSPVSANTRLQSGKVLEYQGHFTNRSADRVRKMTVTMSIPKNLILINQIDPSTVSASVNARDFAVMPLKTMQNGQYQDVPLKFYRALRWQLTDMNANGTAVVKYRAQVK